MDNINNDAANKGLFKRLLHNRWLNIVLEVIGFILLLSKVFPAKWLDSEWPSFALILIALIGLLISNFRISGRLIATNLQKESEIRDAVTKKENETNELIKTLERKAKYADVLPMLNAAFQELHNAVRRDFKDITKYHEPFVIFCQNLERVFSYVTGVECHVCIKMTLYPKNQIPSTKSEGKHLNNLQVKTYCRSSSFSDDRKLVDHKKVTHFINDNTDFEYVFKNEEACFFCADLAELDVYKNSNFKSKNGTAIYFSRETHFDLKVREWPLPYRTTIVAPIRPLIREHSNETNIIGLLCVDSKCPNVFIEEIDKHIMNGCADGIYNSFKKLFNVTALPQTK